MRPTALCALLTALALLPTFRPTRAAADVLFRGDFETGDFRQFGGLSRNDAPDSRTTNARQLCRISGFIRDLLDLCRGEQNRP
jgi:hypothetical protein